MPSTLLPYIQHHIHTYLLHFLPCSAETRKPGKGLLWPFSEFRCRYFCILYLSCTKLGSSYVLIKFFVKQSIVSSHTKLSSLSLQQLVLSLIINVIVAAGSLEQMDTSLPSPGPVSRHRQASVPAPTPDPTITKTN